MLKKILGEAPFDVSLDKRVIITPGKKTAVRLLFSNISEYDLPLSLNITLGVFADIDKSQFDIVVPAEGNTEAELIFSRSPDAMLFVGRGVGEIEIFDGIFDSRTLYEFEIFGEAAYKCTEKSDGLSPSDEAFYTRNGVFFANRGETVFVEIPMNEERKCRLRTVSGKVKSLGDEEAILLQKGINRLKFEMEKDGSFELCDLDNDEKIYPDSVNTKYFL